MNLTPLSELKFEDAPSRTDFFDNNALVHGTIYTALLDGGLLMQHWPMFILGEPDDSWKAVHQNEHDAMSELLQLDDAPQLVDVDFSSEADAADWTYRHWLHHVQVAEALGI